MCERFLDCPGQREGGVRTVTKEVALIGACYLSFALAKNLTDPSPVFQAIVNGWGVIRLESALALNHESFIQQIIGRISVGALAAFTYFYAVGMWIGLLRDGDHSFRQEPCCLHRPEAHLRSYDDPRSDRIRVLPTCTAPVHAGIGHDRHSVATRPRPRTYLGLCH